VLAWCALLLVVPLPLERVAGTVPYAAAVLASVLCVVVEVGFGLGDAMFLV
jgi:hypothetical protein